MEFQSEALPRAHDIRPVPISATIPASGLWSAKIWKWGNLAVPPFVPFGLASQRVISVAGVVAPLERCNLETLCYRISVLSPVE